MVVLASARDVLCFFSLYDMAVLLPLFSKKNLLHSPNGKFGSISLKIPKIYIIAKTTTCEVHMMKDQMATREGGE
jgi:hypothetical protein